MHDGLARVVLPRQQGADLEFADRLGQRRDLGQRLGVHAGVFFGVSEVEQDGCVVEPRAEPLDPAHVALRVRQLARHALRLVGVVPQVGCGRLLLELRHLLTQCRDVEHLLDARQRGIESLELVAWIGGGHEVRA